MPGLAGALPRLDAGLPSSGRRNRHGRTRPGREERPSLQQFNRQGPPVLTRDCNCLCTSGPCVRFIPVRLGRISELAAWLHAELVALRVGQDHPADADRLVSPHRRAEPHQASHLLVLAAVARNHIEAKPILDGLRLRNTDEVQAYVTSWSRTDAEFLLAGLEVSLAHPPAGHSCPEPGDGGCI